MRCKAPYVISILVITAVATVVTANVMDVDVNIRYRHEAWIDKS